MNDSSEGTVLLSYMLGAYKKNRLLQKACKNTCDDKYIFTSKGQGIYLFSLSNQKDKLPMWAQYGDRGEGCCYVFNREYFVFDNEKSIIVSNTNNDSLKIQPVLYKVLYINDKDMDNIRIENDAYTNKALEQISTLISKVSYNNENESIIIATVSQLLDQVRYLFKSIDYKTEDEARIIKIISYDSTLIKHDISSTIPKLYIEVDNKQILNFKEIILGPKVNNPNDIYPYILNCNKSILVSKSNISFR